MPRAVDGSVWTVRGMKAMCGRRKAIGKGEYCSDRKQLKEVFFMVSRNLVTVLFHGRI